MAPNPHDAPCFKTVEMAQTSQTCWLQMSFQPPRGFVNDFGPNSRPHPTPFPAPNTRPKPDPHPPSPTQRPIVCSPGRQVPSPPVPPPPPPVTDFVAPTAKSAVSPEAHRPELSLCIAPTYLTLHCVHQNLVPSLHSSDLPTTHRKIVVARRLYSPHLDPHRTTTRSQTELDPHRTKTRSTSD